MELMKVERGHHQMFIDHTPLAERRLVFISAGDHHLLHPTIGATSGFDVLVYFYGDSIDVRAGLMARGLKVVDRKGDKFQNLLAAHRSDLHFLSQYDAVFVMDDDLGLSKAEITRLFEVRLENDFWVVQPSFDPRGRISFPYSTSRARTSFRYTNFVEMGAPLFRRDILEQFLEVYDGSLVGWGIDFWYMNVLGESEFRRYAVVDEVRSANPDRRSATGSREIEQLQSAEEGQASWERLRDEQGLSQWTPTAFGGVYLTPLDQAISISHAARRNIVALITRRPARSAMVKSARGQLKRVLRDILAGVALRRLRRQTKSGGFDCATIERARNAWGNPSWSATADFVMECLETIPQTSGTALELGSGFSTAVLALALSKNDRQLLALEDHDNWAKRMRRRLRLAGIKNVQVSVRPQDRTDDPACYDEWAGSTTQKMGLVVHAGPSGRTGGRLSQLPCFSHLITEQTIFIFEADDQGLMTAQAFAKTFGFRLEVSPRGVPGGRQYAIMRK